LKKHSLIKQLDENRFMCPECGKTFTNKTTAESHLHMMHEEHLRTVHEEFHQGMHE
jgi:transposase-like protein